MPVGKFPDPFWSWVPPSHRAMLFPELPWGGKNTHWEHPPVGATWSAGNTFLSRDEADPSFRPFLISASRDEKPETSVLGVHVRP